MTTADLLVERIHRRQYLVGVIGLGYVGLPLALRYAEVGFSVFGFDADADKTTRLNKGESYIPHIPGHRVAHHVHLGRLTAVGYERLGEPDALLICVPTPLTRQREPDLQYITATAKDIAAALRPGQLVCLESTTYPGTTEEVMLDCFERQGLSVGTDFFLAYSPEREDPGNRQFNTATIPKVVGGMTPACLRLATALYSQIVPEVVPVSSTRVAEATKILENVYRAVNIALVNELKIAFTEMGIDIWEVIEAAKTKPFGFQPFLPGPGLGGHCIPIDPFYLTWKAREYGVSTRFIELAGEVNSSMPAYVVQRVVDALNARGKATNGSRVLILGVSYKKNVGDIRESPSLKILDLLVAKGARVDYCDPYFSRLPATRRYQFELESVLLDAASLQAYDALVLVTDHSAFPYNLIHSNASIIVDTRNAFGQRGLNGSHVLRA